MLYAKAVLLCQLIIKATQKILLQQINKPIIKLIFNLKIVPIFGNFGKK